MVSLANPVQHAVEKTAVKTAFLIVDTESIPDGRLLNLAKYPGEKLSDDDAIARAQEEARATSFTKSDFLPVTFQIPVAICVARVAADLSLTNVTCLDAPQYRTHEMVRQFFIGYERYKAKLVTFNGRGFDMPLLELAAARYGISAPHYFAQGRHRYNGGLDLMEWFSNFNAFRMIGGLNVLAKMLGLPGKMDVAGNQVYQMHRDGRFQDINDYCMFDTLDTYFLFLRTRVMTGDIDGKREAFLIEQARAFLAERAIDLPALKIYLDNWECKPAR